VTKNKFNPKINQYMKKITIIFTYMKCKLKQQQRIKIDNNYLEKLCKMHVKKTNLSVIDRLLNRLKMYFPM
jgi:hypothetical protein